MRGGSDEADAHRAAFARGAGARGQLELLGMEEGAARFVQGGQAGFGQLHALPSAHEQRHAHHVFKLADRDRQRGLGHMQLFRRTVEVQRLGKHQELL
ncbi:hypothetical protein D3C72_1955360 [compost metagenome]